MYSHTWKAMVKMRRAESKKPANIEWIGDSKALWWNYSRLYVFKVDLITQGLKTAAKLIQMMYKKNHAVFNQVIYGICHFYEYAQLYFIFGEYESCYTCYIQSSLIQLSTYPISHLFPFNPLCFSYYVQKVFFSSVVLLVRSFCQVKCYRLSQWETYCVIWNFTYGHTTCVKIKKSYLHDLWNM